MNYDWLYWGLGYGLGLLGLGLVYWFLLADRAKGRKRCPKCWYDMAIADSLRCPECGKDAKNESALLKTRRKYKGLWWCLLVFLVAGYLWVQPKVKRDGWLSVMPNTMLILCLRLGDNQAFIGELDKRTQIDASKHHSAVNGYLVPESESLFQWQWRFVGDTCVDLKMDDYDVSNRQRIFDLLHRASFFVPAEDADTYYQATLSFLADDDPGIRGMAALSCADARFSESYLGAIRPLLDDPIEHVRVRAVYCLGIIVRYSQAAESILVKALAHEDAQVRAGAAYQLGSIAEYGEVPKLAFEPLVALYQNDPDAQVRARALRAICKYESKREKAIEFMRESFSSSEMVIREEAIWSLTLMDQFDEAFDLEFALKGLADESEMVRSDAAYLLERRISTDSLRPHVEYLRDFENSDDEDVRRAVRHHLEALQETIEDE